jgi:hypothetical protein
MLCADLWIAYFGISDKRRHSETGLGSLMQMATARKPEPGSKNSREPARAQHTPPVQCAINFSKKGTKYFLKSNKEVLKTK